MADVFVVVKAFADASVAPAFAVTMLGHTNIVSKGFLVIFVLAALDMFAFVDMVNSTETGLQLALIFVVVVFAAFLAI